MCRMDLHKANTIPHLAVVTCNSGSISGASKGSPDESWALTTINDVLTLSNQLHKKTKIKYHTLVATFVSSSLVARIIL
jgi:hypothetical protein